MKAVLLVVPLFAAGLLFAAESGRSEDEPLAAGTGEERVLSFRSEITVLPDASLDVRETIRVLAARRQINHGIYRDFPTRFRSADGIWFDVPFTLTEVLRDGKPEPWQAKERENGLRAYIGDAELLLEPGEHTYSIGYRTERQLGFFRDHDELFWNVTGYDWALPMDEVEARVKLPSGVSGVSLEVQTGLRGSKERDATASWDRDRGATFRSTRPFEVGEGLTVVVKWPKGVVREPVEPQLWWWYFLGSNRSAVAGLAGLLLVLTFYVLAGRQVARQPGRGVIVSRGEAPAGLSPAAIRMVRTGKCDERALAATLVRMAIKGHLVIEERGGLFTLRRSTGDKAALAPEEALVADDLALGRSDQIGVESANHDRIGAALNGLKNFLRASLERFYVLRNREFLLPGVMLSVIVLVATLTLEPGLRTVTRGLIAVLLFLWTIGVALLAVQIEYRWHDVLLHRGDQRDTLFHAASITVFAIPFFVAEIVGLGLLIWLGSYSYGVVLLSLALLNARFHYLLKTRASAGRGVLDRIEGLETWLVGAETDGNCGLGPEPVAVVCEKFLPYAIALEREGEWFRQCAAASTRAGKGDGSYRPAWFQTGSAVAKWSPALLASTLGVALSAAIASSTAAPRSTARPGPGRVFSGKVAEMSQKPRRRD